jgi:hypothetical protein
MVATTISALSAYTWSADVALDAAALVCLWTVYHTFCLDVNWTQSHKKIVYAWVLSAGALSLILYLTTRTAGAALVLRMSLFTLLNAHLQDAAPWLTLTGSFTSRLPTRWQSIVPGIAHFLPFAAVLSWTITALFQLPGNHLSVSELEDTTALVMLALPLTLLTVAALLAWSWWTGGEYGKIVDTHAHLLTSARILPIATINAVAEEIDFRFIFLEALARGAGALAMQTAGTRIAASATASSSIWHTALLPLLSSPRFVFAAAVTNVLFALEHVNGGFPSGRVGGVLVFSWGFALALLKEASHGLLQGLVVHIIADVVIFALLVVAKRKLLGVKKPRRAAASRRRQKTLKNFEERRRVVGVR